MKCMRVLATLVALLLAPILHAQGTSSSFPDPISSREIDQWASWLGIGAINRLAIDPMHEDYRDKYRQLRDSRIEDYLKTNPGPGGFMGMAGESDRTQIEARVKERTEIIRAIERLDNQFLAQLKTIVPDAQAGDFETVELAAKRHRARGVIGGMFLSFVDANLAENVRAVEEGDGELADALNQMDADSRKALDASLLDYERSITRRLDDMSEAYVKSPLLVHDAIKASGVERPTFDPENPPAPEAFEGWWRAMETARESALKNALDARRAIAQSHRSFLSKLKSQLPEPVWREVRNRFLRRAYNEAWPDQESAEPAFEQAAKLPDLSSQEKETVASARAAWQASHDAATETMMDAVDDTRKDHMRMFFDEDQWKAHEDKMKSLRASRQTVNKNAENQLHTLLGDRLAKAGGDNRTRELPAGFRMEGLDIAAEGGIITIDDGGLGEVIVHAVNTAVGGGHMDNGDAYLPGPITRRELEQYAKMLALPEERQPILDVLVDEYSNSFQEARNEEMEGTRDMNAMPAFKAGEPPEPPKPPQPQDIERLYAARKSAWDRLRRLDDEFLDSLESIASPTAPEGTMDSVRSARLRQVLNRERAGRGGGPGFMFGPGSMSQSRESSVDLVDMVRETELPDAAREAASESIPSYEPAFIELLRKGRETAIDAQKDIDLFHAKAMQVDEEGRVRVEIRDDNEDFKVMQAAQQRIADASEAIAALNRRTAEEITGHLSGDAQIAFRRAYQRAGFPSVYRDPKNAEPTLLEALKFDDISPEQIGAIGELLQSHRAEYEKLADTMVEATRNNAPKAAAPGEFNPEMMQAMQSLQNTMKKLRFDRTELNASSLRKLKAILAPEQAARLAALDDSKKNNTPDMPEGTIFFGP